MGNWNIEIKGVGAHHNGVDEDADRMARAFVQQLAEDGHAIEAASFTVADGDEGSSESIMPCHDFEAPHPDNDPRREHIMQYFAYAHLPPHLRAVSRQFHDLAIGVVMSLPRNPERTVALRKLLEAKDAAVRARLAAPKTAA